MMTSAAVSRRLCGRHGSVTELPTTHTDSGHCRHANAWVGTGGHRPGWPAELELARVVQRAAAESHAWAEQVSACSLPEEPAAASRGVVAAAGGGGRRQGGGRA